MNDKFDDFSDLNNLLDNITIEREKTKFELTQLKIEHYHWNYDNISAGMPVSTSIELNCEYSLKRERLEWKKTVTHTYLSLSNSHEYTTDSYTEEMPKPDTILKEIEQYDLRDLKNNYFTDKDPDRFSHWELTYNNYFKIVGTYDQEIKEFSIISKLLEFRKTIDEEIKKVQEKLEQINI